MALQFSIYALAYIATGIITLSSPSIHGNGALCRAYSIFSC